MRINSIFFYWSVSPVEIFRNNDDGDDDDDDDDDDGDWW